MAWDSAIMSVLSVPQQRRHWRSLSLLQCLVVQSGAIVFISRVRAGALHVTHSQLPARDTLWVLVNNGTLLYTRVHRRELLYFISYVCHQKEDRSVVYIHRRQNFTQSTSSEKLQTQCSLYLTPLERKPFRVLQAGWETTRSTGTSKSYGALGRPRGILMSPCS